MLDPARARTTTPARFVERIVFIVSGWHDQVRAEQCNVWAFLPNGLTCKLMILLVWAGGDEHHVNDTSFGRKSFVRRNGEALH
jgi:hypothetical protein